MLVHKFNIKYVCLQILGSSLADPGGGAPGVRAPPANDREPSTFKYYFYVYAFRAFCFRYIVLCFKNMVNY